MFLLQNLAHQSPRPLYLAVSEPLRFLDESRGHYVHHIPIVEVEQPADIGTEPDPQLPKPVLATIALA
jgi:hypothetical protein